MLNKKRIIFLGFFAALFSLLYLIKWHQPAEAAPLAAASCKTCHADFVSVLPKGHPPVKGTDLGSCTSCHTPDLGGTAQKNTFSSRMHRAHIAPKGSLACKACHSWTPGKKFGLIGQKGSWGNPKKDDMILIQQIFSSWANSNYTDNLHAKAGIVCTQCHGKYLPKADTTVDNSRCLTCHGPMEQLAQKTELKDFEKRNPHKSHLDNLNCTVCHKGHTESKVYCLDCHRNFQMKIQGGAKQ